MLSHDKNLHIGKLSNGFSYAIKKNTHPKNRTYIELIIDAGARNEAPEENGASHFIEHLAFKATKHFKSGEVFELMKEEGVPQGSHANAYTSSSKTVYHFYVPSTPKTLEKALFVLSEFAQHLALLPNEITAERKVILEELRRAMDKDYRYFLQFLSATFGTHPYGTRSILGTKSSLAGLDPKRLRAYYNNWYIAPHMHLVIVGDVSPTVFPPLIKKYFSTLPKKKALPLSLPSVADTHTPTIFFHKDKEYTDSTLTIGIRRPYRGNTTPKTRALSTTLLLLRWILEERFQDLIQSEARIEHISSSSDTNNFLPYHLTYFHLYTHNSSIKKGLTLLLTEIERLRQHGVLASELERAKKKGLELLDTYKKELKRTTHPSVAKEISYCLLSGNTFYEVQEDIRFTKKIVEQLRPQDLHELIHDYFDYAKNSVFGFALSPHLTLTKKEVQDCIRAVRSRALAPLPSQEEHPLQSLPPTTPPVSPQISLVPKANGTLYTYPNGLNIYTRQTSLEPDSIHLTCYFLGGQLMEGTPGISDLYERVLFRGGITHHSFRDIQRLLHTKKISLSFEKWGAVGFFLRLSTSLTYFEEGLKLFSSLIREPAFRPYDCKKAQEELAQGTKQYETQQSYHHEKLISEMLYPDHPLSHYPTPSALRKLSLKEAARFHKKIFRASNMSMGIVGNISALPTPLLPLLNLYLGSLPALPPLRFPKKVLTVGFPLTSTTKTLKKGKEDKAFVRIVYRGVRATDPTSPILDVLADALTEELEKKIREKMSGTYSIYAINAPASLVDTGTFEIYFECDPKRTQVLIRAIQELLLTLPTLFTEGHVTRVLKPLLHAHEEAVQENDFWMRLPRNIALGRPLTFDLDLIPRIKKVKLQDIIRMSTLLFHDTTALIGIVEKRPS